MAPSSPSSTTTPPPPPPLLDHIVILIPHSFLISPPSWFSAPFRFAPGGRHADGLTENRLVLLADGSYLEFIAFVPGGETRRLTHRWGRKPEGTVIDWALTLHAPGDDGDGDGDGDGDDEGKGEIKHGAEFRKIQERVEQADADAGIVYADPVRGGRVRPDGVQLRWAVASAKRKNPSSSAAAAAALGAGGDKDGWVPLEPGQLPFWCLDETPRRLRVPYEEDADQIRHPTGVVGVAEVEVAVGGESGSKEEGKEREALGAVYDAVFGKQAAGKGDAWEVRTLAGEGRHPPGRVVLAAAQEGGSNGTGAADIKITFYTDDEDWVGKTIGGKVDDEHTLEFKLVAATSK